MHGSALDGPSWRGWEWGVVGVPGDGGLYNALSSPMFLSLSVSSLLGFLFLVLLLTLTLTIFGFLHLCSMQKPSPFMFAKCACKLNPLVFFFYCSPESEGRMAEELKT